MKYVFVTGGVVSGLGKGICAASLGRLLKQRGLKVRNQKFDPYLNVDPGTMSPYQHGEVFVTDDGAETDLDLGHYERFVDESLTGRCSVSSGRVYWDLLNRERQGAFLGGTVLNYTIRHSVFQGGFFVPGKHRGRDSLIFGPLCEGAVERKRDWGRDLRCTVLSTLPPSGR